MRSGLIVLFTLTAGVTTGCALVDAPRPVPVDYAAREAQKIDPDDSCGPEFIQDNLPAWVVSATTPVFDGPFRPACERHDACYGLEEYSQAWCDDRFLEEMRGICETGRAGGVYSAPLIGPMLCRRRANAYHFAVNNTLGAFAYGDGDKVYPPGGQITSHEIETSRVCVDVLNNTQVMQEYDVLFYLDDRLIDREPDLHHRNVRAGETTRFCGALTSNLEGDVKIILRADRPDSFIFNDVVETIAELEVGKSTIR